MASLHDNRWERTIDGQDLAESREQEQEQEQQQQQQQQGRNDEWKVRELDRGTHHSKFKMPLVCPCERLFSVCFTAPVSTSVT